MSLPIWAVTVPSAGKERGRRRQARGEAMPAESSGRGEAGCGGPLEQEETSDRARRDRKKSRKVRRRRAIHGLPCRRLQDIQMRPVAKIEVGAVGDLQPWRQWGAPRGVL
jgi:hypothetical protein